MGIEKNKVLVIDMDGTICHKKRKGESYEKVKPNSKVIKKICEYKNMGFKIIIYSSRQMRTYEGNLGKINAKTLPTMIKWLKKYKVPYDEIYIGKPWCGSKGFYVDDETITPEEFVTKEYKWIIKKLGKG